jgi:hypothetical protein
LNADWTDGAAKDQLLLYRKCTVLQFCNSRRIKSRLGLQERSLLAFAEWIGLSNASKTTQHNGASSVSRTTGHIAAERGSRLHSWRRTNEPANSVVFCSSSDTIDHMHFENPSVAD